MSITGNPERFKCMEAALEEKMFREDADMKSHWDNIAQAQLSSQEELFNKDPVLSGDRNARTLWSVHCKINGISSPPVSRESSPHGRE